MIESFATYFDLETGGLTEAHPDIQLAAITVNESTGDEVGVFQHKIRFDEAAADPTALALNHYDRALWEREAMEPRTLVESFAEFLRPHRSIEMTSKRTGARYTVAKLIGHNSVSFDGPRLQRLFKAHGIFLPADPRFRCTVQRAMWWFDEHPTRKAPDNFKLGTLCEYFGIPTTGAHDALADVRMTIALARALRLESERAAA